MESLVKRIKDLSAADFHHVCFNVLKAKYPTADIRFVEGAAGDDGVDLFEGDLEVGVTVWQCKAFQVTVLGNSQRQQIRESLKTAASKTALKRWVPCLNVTFDTKTYRWFGRLQASYRAVGILIADPFDAAEIARELLIHRSILNSFFPNLLLDPAELRALVTRNGSLDDSALEMISTENVETWIERLADRDRRFLYEISFGGERDPKDMRPEKDLVAALWDGRKTMKAFARDHEALRLDPIRFEFEVDQNDHPKLHELIRKGTAQSISVNTFSTNLPLLQGVKIGKSGKLTFEPIADDSPVPLRLTFRLGDSEALIKYAEFIKRRSGTDELEIVTKLGRPFPISIVMPKNLHADGTITASLELIGKPLAEAELQCRVIQMLQSGCEVEAHLIAKDVPLGKFVTSGIDRKIVTAPVLTFISELREIADFFNANLVVPSEFTLEAHRTFEFLQSIVRGTDFEIGAISFGLEKSTENASTMKQTLGSWGSLISQGTQETIVNFLGEKINLGLLNLHFKSVEVLNPDDFLARFEEARIGDSVRMRIRALSGVRIYRALSQGSGADN